MIYIINLQLYFSSLIYFNLLGLILPPVGAIPIKNTQKNGVINIPTKKEQEKAFNSKFLDELAISKGPSDS